LGGNIGKPLLELLPKLKSSSYVVMEISSFQLIDLPVSPDIAVILNITLDHLDWHESKEEYIEAKKNIVKYQNTSDWAIINKEYKVSSSFARKTKANIMYFSKKTLKNEFKKDLILRGEHNLENIAAAVSVSKVLNINELANVLKPVVFPGEQMQIKLIKEGKEHNQAVGYLDDGTMVVVEEARRLIGQEVKVAVTSVLQTQAGRMIFTKLER